MTPTVVVLASSSRGGSSVTASWLRRTRQLLHFRAEVNPFFQLAGLQGADDSVPEGAPTDALWARMRSDIGRPGPFDRQDFARDLLDRLALQWPGRHFTLDEVLQAMPSGPVDDRFHNALLQGLGLCRFYYDLAPRAEWGTAPQGPPPRVLEEPPLVCIQPWERARALDRPLVIKTPSLAYRLPYLRRLFKGWRFRVLHLVRGPGAAINGLVDGWRYPTGFFSHRLDLAIQGYSELYPFGQWWNFDLPPGWSEWRSAHLNQVCGFQWRSAHGAILDFLDSHPGIEAHRVHFEDLFASREACRGLLDWLEVDDPVLAEGPSSMPAVMATARPRDRRWFDRAEELDQVIQRPDTLALASRLEVRE